MIIVLLFAGCVKKPGAENEKNPTVGSGSHFSEVVSDCFTIEADVQNSCEREVPLIYECEIPTFSHEQLTEFLTASGDCVSEVFRDQTMDDIYNYDAATEKGGRAIVLASGAYQSYSFSYINQEKAGYDVVHRCSPYERPILSEDEYDNSELFLEPREIAFASPEEAEAQVRQALSIFGIEDLTVRELLYLDHDTLNAELHNPRAVESSTSKHNAENSLDVDRVYSADDDAYYFYFDVTKDGVPMIEFLEFSRVAGFASPFVTVGINKNGIFDLNIQEPKRILDPVETPEKIITAGEALAVVRENLHDVIVPYRQVLDSVSLRYYAIQDRDRVVFRPCWEFRIYCYDYIFEGNSAVRGYHVDALTGQEL